MHTADEIRKLPNLSVEYAALSDADWAATQLPKSAAGAAAVLAEYAEPLHCESCGEQHPSVKERRRCHVTCDQCQARIDEDSFSGNADRGF